MGRRGRRAVVLAVTAAALLLSACQSKAGGGGNGGNGGNGGDGGPPTGIPAWVQAGTRVTWYTAGASVNQSRFAWVEDPGGEWLDKATGKRYRRTDESGEGQPGSGGDGFSQVDILALEGADVVASNTLYLLNRVTNTITPLPLAGARVNGEIVDGAWISPARLQALQDARTEGLLIVRGPYTIAGTTYQAIAFATTAAGNTQQYTYDLATGVLLSATTFAQGATSPVHAVGEAPPQGNNLLTVTRFAGMRTRSMPGAGGTNPQWVGGTRELVYIGTQSTFNPLDPTQPALVLGMRVSIALGPGGAGWATFTEQIVIDSPLSQPTGGSGVTGASGLYWIDPQALAKLTAGQVLDVDPVTGERVSVAGFDQSGAFVSLQTDLPNSSVVTTYSTTTGALVAYRSQNNGTGQVIELQLQNPP
jgi:hypothetical protein